MTPLGVVALGCLIAFFDLRLQGLDLLLDPGGWLLALTGLRRLGLRGTATAAVVAGVLSLTSVVETDDALVGHLTTAYGAAQSVVLVVLCLALRDRARAAGDERSAGRFSGFAVALVVLGAVALLLGALLADADDVGAVLGAGVPLLVVGLTDLAVSLWLLVVLVQRRHEAWAQGAPVRGAPPAAAAPSAG